MSYPFNRRADDGLSSSRLFLYKLCVTVTGYIRKSGFILPQVRGYSLFWSGRWRQEPGHIVSIVIRSREMDIGAFNPGPQPVARVPPCLG